MTLAFGTSTGNLGTYRNLDLCNRSLQNWQFVVKDFAVPDRFECGAQCGGHISQGLFARVSFTHDRDSFAEAKRIGHKAIRMPSI